MAQATDKEMNKPLNLLEREELIKLRKRVEYLQGRVDQLERQVVLTPSNKAGSAELMLGMAPSESRRRGRLASISHAIDATQNLLTHRRASVAGLSRDELTRFVRLAFDNTTAEDVRNIVLPELNSSFHGSAQGICKSLTVEPDQGLGDAKDLKTRKDTFGQNVIPMEPQTSIFVLMWNALQDPTLIFLCFAAMVSLFIGVVVEQEPLGWLEGTAILSAVVVVVLVGSINDYQKESQFRALNAKKDDMTVTVLRNKQKVEMSCHELVVGDIVLLSTGDIVSADGYIIGNNDLAINEKMLTGETVNKKKGEYEFSGDGKAVTKSPVVYAGTFVQEGEGRMVVLAVGTSTYQGTMQQKMVEADAQHSRSVLQQKLDDMTDVITQGGAGFAILTVLVLCVRMWWAFHQGLCCKEQWDHHVHWSELLSFLISGVTIFVVAVPEGLPLAVTIALAFSVKKMLKDQNLVRHLSACETMGSATTICSDKTGTLTTSRMTVVKIYCGNEIFEDIANVNLSDALKQGFMEAAVVNTMSKTNLVASAKPGVPTYTGNDTECGLLVMANVMGKKGGEINYESEDMPYKEIRRKFPEDTKGRKQFTFSSARKRMSTRVPLSSGGYRYFCKGAAEMVVDICTKRMLPNGQIESLGNNERKQIVSVIALFADEALRTICIAYKDSDKEFDDVEEAEAGLTMIGLVGIEDPVRDEVPQAIKDCHKASIIVRMVTGDNMRTAAAIAKKCGILDPNIPEEEQIIDGKTFRERVADKDGNLIQAEIDKIWPKLRVMGRSTPLDKHLLVSGLQASRLEGHAIQTVAVTGDGTNDAPALKKADVGFAMGIQGTDVAKNASDVIIMDDNFVSIVKAVMWGRCVYDNICKFLQFQLTVNITAIVVACVGSAVLTESPLTAIQMLWVNLIMDSFASLALATEDPAPALLNRKPYPRDRGVLSKVMMKNMLMHAAWQLLVLGVLIFLVGDVCQPGQELCDCSRGALSHIDGYFGTKPLYIPSGRPAGFDLATTAASGACPPFFNSSDSSTYTKSWQGVMTPLRPAGYCKHAGGGRGSTTQHYTMVFNIFVLMQVFNEINSRKIHDELNVFDGIHKNALFLFIVIGTLIGQVALIEAPGLNTAFGCESLTQDQWLICLVLGASTIPLNILLRFIPSSIFPGSK